MSYQYHFDFIIVQCFSVMITSQIPLAPFFKGELFDFALKNDGEIEIMHSNIIKLV